MPCTARVCINHIVCQTINGVTRLQKMILANPPTHSSYVTMLKSPRVIYLTVSTVRGKSVSTNKKAQCM